DPAALRAPLLSPDRQSGPRDDRLDGKTSQHVETKGKFPHLRNRGVARRDLRQPGAHSCAVNRNRFAPQHVLCCSAATFRSHAFRGTWAEPVMPGAAMNIDLRLKHEIGAPDRKTAARSLHAVAPKAFAASRGIALIGNFAP